MKYIANIILAAASLGLSANAAEVKNVLDLKYSITDSNIVYPESYELNTQKRLESWYLKNYTASDERYKNQGDVSTSDDVIRDRLAKMNTVIEMPFNQIVRSYIDRYTSKSRSGVSALLGLSLYYMPIFEQALEEQGLPLELKYLPIIESGLNPNAVSKSGAAGLWQFILATGKGMGLEISSLVDERRDPYKSSRKAAEYLKSLYETYGDWSLAIAAYNCGPGTVNKAIRRAGGDPASHDYWSIYYYLPAETRGYVPMFIAANYVMNYYPYHNISPVLATKPLITDTLMIGTRVHLEQISKVLDIPMDELRVLNPQFRADIIPGYPDRRYTLVLPSQQIHAYIMSENDIYNYEADKYALRVNVEPGVQPGEITEEVVVADTFIAEEQPLEPSVQTTTTPRRKSSNSSGNTTVIHKVEPGESLAIIADKYAVSVDDLKAWNNLSRNSVRTGQQLRITTSPELAAANGATKVTSSQSAPKAQTQPSQTKSQTQASTTVAQNKQSAKQSKKAEAKNQVAQNSKSSQNKKDKKKAEPAAPKDHTVKSGENLSTIAKKYGTTAAELQKANGLKGETIHPGDKLKLPTKGKAKSNAKSNSKDKKDSKAGKKSSGTKKKKK